VARFGDDTVRTLKEVSEDAFETPAIKVIGIESDASGRNATDFMSQLDQRTKAARKKAAGNVALGLMIEDELKLDVGAIVPIFADLETLDERRLKEAKELVGRKHYDEAILVLDELLANTPDHHEGLYLRAFCQFSLDAYEPTLRTLLQARKSGPSKRMQTRMSILREQTRAPMQESVVHQYLKALQKQQYPQAIARMKELIELDPDCGLYHYLLCGTFMLTGSLDVALRTAVAGQDLGSPDERAQMLALRRQIEDKLTRQKLVPARELFKAGKYGEASSLLAQLDDVTKGTVLWQSFNVYATHCVVEGQRNPPKLGYTDAESIYEFLIEQELDVAKSCFFTDRFEHAESLLEGALVHVSHYAFGNFLYANSAYRRVMTDLTKQSPLSIDEVVATFDRAVQCARVGATDPANPQALELLEVLTAVQAQFVEFRHELELRRRENDKVNGVIREFQAIMDSVKNGVSSEQQLDGVEKRLRKLRQDLPKLRHDVSEGQAHEAVVALGEAVERNLDMIKEVRAEAKRQEQEANIVNPLWKELETIMQSVKGGIRSESQLRTIQSSIEDLRNRTTKTRREVSSKPALEAIDELYKTLKNQLTQLRDLGPKLRENEKINALAGRFTARLEAVLRQGGISDYAEAVALKTFLSELKGDANRLLGQVNDKTSKKNVHALIASIDRHLDQLNVI